MDERECLSRMVPPSQKRSHKEQMRGGIIQIMITRACDKACYNCTQNSQLGSKPVIMPVEQFEQACKSLQGYWGVIGIFGGNPCTHPQFEQICDIFCRYFPREQRGLWSNHPRGKGAICRRTFNPITSNLNVHMNREAWNEFKRDWPESRPFGLDDDSRHSPCFVSMRDLGIPEEKRWELISNCDINQHWSALIGVFRGQPRAYFCEIAYAQAMLHESEEDYPDTGLNPTKWYQYGSATVFSDPNDISTGALRWWQLPMTTFAHQVRQHCHDCGVPLRGYGQLALTETESSREQVSQTHATNYHPKTKGRRVELVTVREQLGETLRSTVDYVGNARRPKEEIVR